MSERILLCLAHMSGKEMDFIKEAFDDNWVVPMGPNVTGFEKDLEAFVNKREHGEPLDKKVVCLSAGTAAVHLALIACGVKPGDEVLVQSFTFCASSHPITYLGATPVFIDSEKDSWNMDPDLLEEAIKDRIAKTGKTPKAIIPVALYGMPYRIDRIMEIADRYGIPVIEDGAEGFGSTFNGQALGTFGRYGVLSFNGNKMITTSGGGALICPDAEKAREILWYATQARESYPYYQHEAIGYNYRMTNVQACLGLAQLERLESFVETKKARYDQYKAALDGVHGLRILPFKEESDGVRSNHWFYSLYLKNSGLDRDTVIAKLQEQGIQTRPVWALINEQADYPKNEAYALEKAQDYRKYIVNLPCSTNLTEQDCERVIAAVKNL